MAFLRDQCFRAPLTDAIVKHAAPFSCGNVDLDEFFAYNETAPCEYYQKNGFAFMFSSEVQEREYRNIAGDHPLHTRLMYFDLMQIVQSDLQPQPAMGGKGS